MKAVVCALLLCVALVAAESSSIVKGKFAEEVYQNAFTNWMQEHKKTYASSEFGARYNAFKWNFDFVEDWNSKNYSAVLGMNIMADLTNAEYRRMYLGTKIDATEALMRAEPFVQTVEPLAIKDWRTSGAVTGVKDQGQCGSCWSFSATGSIEGAYYISKGKLTSLSEQNLMDCSTSYGNAACNGGLMTSAFKYVQANKGIDTEASYPYTAKTQTSCKFSTANIGATITGYKTVSAGSESALVTAIGVAPVSVAIDASKNSFQLYKSGTYYEASCSSSNLDHGVLAVGYDTDYYIVKNSWGTSWGMSGYINMSRNRNNNCGIATQAAYATA